MDDLLQKRSIGRRVQGSYGTAPLGFPNHTTQPGWSAWQNGSDENSASNNNPYHLITRNTPARLYQHRKQSKRSRWGTRTWNTWYAMEHQSHLPPKYLNKLNVKRDWWDAQKKLSWDTIRAMSLLRQDTRPTGSSMPSLGETSASASSSTGGVPLDLSRADARPPG
mmetsp:Transcript_13608/g.24284  ORF Transcript_13608/g.24284 Transcript_13608/m.24284 type:complete len:166 (+) Transcript_13608:430-927(+)